MAELREKPDISTTNPKSKLNKTLTGKLEVFERFAQENAMGESREKELLESRQITEQQKQEADKKRAIEAGEQIENLAEKIVTGTGTGKRKLPDQQHETDTEPETETEPETDQEQQKEQERIERKIISEDINELAELPVWQKFDVAQASTYARNRAQKLTEYANNLDRHCETIVAAATDIAKYKTTVSETDTKLPVVLFTMAKAREKIYTNLLLKRSESITKLLLNIIDLHKTTETPQRIQQRCLALGNKIIRHNKFSIAEKVQLTSFVLIIRDTMALMTNETLPALQTYIKSIQGSEEYKQHSIAEQRVISALTPAFRCCSAFTSWLTNIPRTVANSTFTKFVTKAIGWGFNPGTVATVGTWLNQEAIIHSMGVSGSVPEVYPTEYLSFKIAFVLSTLVFGSTVYFYYQNKKDRDLQPQVPTRTQSSSDIEHRREQLEEELKQYGAQTIQDLPSDHPLKKDTDLYGVFNFLQKFQKDYFPDIEDKMQRDSVPILPNILNPAILEILPLDQTTYFDALNTKEEASAKASDLTLQTATKEKKNIVRAISGTVIKQGNNPIIRRVRQIDTSKSDAKTFVNAIINAPPQQPGAAAAADTDMDATQQLSSQGSQPIQSGSQGSAFRRKRKSVRNSVRKSKGKPVRKSLRKSKRKSVRKSLRKSKRKSVGKSKRKPVRKSLRKPLKKSVRKSLRKPVRKSLRKSLRKSKRKSLRKPVKKSLKKSVRKSTRKNKVMKKSR